MHDLSLYLLELLENSVRAQAGQVAVTIYADHASDCLRLMVDDDVTGLKTEPEDVLDPFYTTKEQKKTGLGLSLLKADVEQAGGYLVIGASPTLGGVRVEAGMELTHVDRPPLGDINTTILVMQATHPAVRFTIDLAGDRFEPPVHEATLSEVGRRLASTVTELDRQAVGETRMHEAIHGRAAQTDGLGGS